jgi:hypothetical protein
MSLDNFIDVKQEPLKELPPLVVVRKTEKYIIYRNPHLRYQVYIRSTALESGYTLPGVFETAHEAQLEVE